MINKLYSVENLLAFWLMQMFIFLTLNDVLTFQKVIYWHVSVRDIRNVLFLHTH